VTIAEQLTEDMKTSMRAGDAARTGVLRLLRGALKNEEIKLGQSLDEAAILKVLQREAKQRRDSIEAYRSAGRTDLVEQEEMELAIISGYLPEAMSDEELTKLVEVAIADTGATSPAQMGVVIGRVMGEVGGRAEGGRVSQVVREKLSQ
jgi:uncharacterized protein